jgi:hypothetical protein
MRKVNFITSFNETILKNIGHHFLNSVNEQWEPKLPLTCYYHDCKIDSYSLPNNSISYKDLSTLKNYNTFKDNNSQHDGTEGNQIPYNIKLDSLKWCHKVFALTEHAFELAEKDADAGWLIWIDADSYAQKRFVLQDVLKMLPDNVDIAYSGVRKYDDGTSNIDASFMAFNLSKQPALDLLGDLQGAYISGEVFQYREWHDAFITERLLNIYKAHGMKVLDIGEKVKDYILHLKGVQDPSLLPLRDSKGNRIFNLSDETSPDIIPGRYKQLADIIRHFKPKTILETGTWNGGRAIEMALAAFEHTDKVVYYGFDLFEEATTETDLEEFNVKAHNKLSAVEKRLTDFAAKMKEKNKEFQYVLSQGNTRETLYVDNLFKFLLEIDFALVGGGNSIKTVQSDYNAVKHVPVVVLDHYFLADKEGNDVQDKFKGVNKVIEKLDKKTRRNILPSADRVKGGGHTHLACVVHDNKLPKIPRELLNVPIVVNPRDCVPKDYIRNNIRANLKLIKDDKWLGKYPFHKQSATIVSGGPYTDYKALHAHIKNNPHTKVIAVKHSYLKLLEHNIKPWACIVLDPRPITGTSTHGIVRKDLFKTIDPTTKFFVASMTDPSVTEYLKEKGADIHGWHAFTESLRDEEERKRGITNNQVTLREDIGIPKGATLITGGTCAAMRAIGIMHTMGFRYFDLFGYDSCMEEPTAEQKKETTGAEDEEPRPKYFEVGVKDKKFWTTGELLAMAQDCEKIFNENVLEMDITFHGKDTLVSALWDISQNIKSKQPNFERDFA